MENYRNFTVTGAFGTVSQVAFKWQQNAITIRHADAVDVKFEVTTGGIEEEKVLALSHPFLLKLSAETGRILSDPWCCKLAAAHLTTMIVTGEDIEKTLITLSYADMKKAAQSLDAVPSAA
jgi:hypothetical protein